jgi:hypothetical protein
MNWSIKIFHKKQDHFKIIIKNNSLHAKIISLQVFQNLHKQIKIELMKIQ